MTMITTEPPAERDVSPTRHAQLRAEAMRRIGRPQRPGWAVPSIAAAVTALLIAGAAAAVPVLRHEQAQAAHGPLPGLLVATYTTVSDHTVTGRKIYDPASGRYLVQAGAKWLNDPSPDLGWIAAPNDTFDQVRITTPGRILDTHAGLVDPAAIAAWTAAPYTTRWADDGSRYYLAGKTAHGARLLGIDPASRRVVSSTDITLPAEDWELLSADPHDGFIVLLSSGVVRVFAPNGGLLDTRQVRPPNPPNVIISGVSVSPDHTRVAVSGHDGTRVVDLRTGREVHASAPGSAMMWADADHYVSVVSGRDHGDVYLVDAATGKAVGHRGRAPGLGADNGWDALVPFDGPAPPGADTVTF
jgi:hypothetical protein